MNECNCGVKCTVNNCRHNNMECGCTLKTIEVTMGGNSNAHFCKSYEEKCNCGCKPDCCE